MHMKFSRIPKNRNEITGAMEQCISRSNEVEARIENALAVPATIVVTGTDPADLQTAISGAADGDVIEVRTNAAYSPITLPGDKTLIVRAGQGYGPRLTGTRCIRLVNGSDGHIVSGFAFESYTTGAPNHSGAGIDFDDYNAKANNCIFHDLNFGQVTAGSAVMLSYHWTKGSDNYANPPQPSELSDTISFVDCHFWKAGVEGTEGGVIALRAFAHPLVLRCQIHGENMNSRGIQMQNCTDILIKDCTVHGYTGGNGEGIKIDSIGSPVAVRESGLIVGNRVFDAIEGIDVDDDADMVVIDNLCAHCTDEGISVDDSAKALIVGNVCFSCGIGIMAEAGAVTEMQSNCCFGNTTDYSILNGYALPSSNVQHQKNGLRYPQARTVPFDAGAPGDWAVSDPKVTSNAIDRLAAAVAGLLGNPIP